MTRKRVAVDFDGTITQGEVAFWDGEEPEPNQEVIDWVNEQYFAGHSVFIWTARDESRRPQTERWLKEWGVYYHALVMDKLSADMYVDDKAFTPEGALTAEVEPKPFLKEEVANAE